MNLSGPSLLLTLSVAVAATHPLASQQTRSAEQGRADSTRQRIRLDGRARSESRARSLVSRRGRLDEPTVAAIATAFADARARTTIDRARVARGRQDSTLTSYDATVKQRLSAGLNVKAFGAERLLFRSELAARVRWAEANRVWVDVLGARTAVPVSFPGARVLTGVGELVPVPYFTGSERLMWWFNFDGGEAEDDDDVFSYVHPLERGAESVYRYRSGDSAQIQLPGGRVISLHEIVVQPREASADLIAGSLWFEADEGQLVRAAFRPAAPMDLMRVVGEESFEDVPAPIRATLLTPFTFDVESFTIDYGLYGGRWWLPRAQTARGQMRIGFMRSTATLDQTFRYASVNGTDSLPRSPLARRRFGSDFGDDIGQVVTGVVDGLVPGKQFRRRDRDLGCAKGDTAVHREWRGDVRMTISMPCDTAALLHSPELPPSIYDRGERAFALADARALAREVGLDEELAKLGIRDEGAGSSRSARTTTVAYGWRDGLLRYNRVEGLSAGARVERPIGARSRGALLVRLGTGDLEPNVTLSLGRGVSGRRAALSGYHRLERATDWGDPFGLGGSLSALVFGRDEGFYFRSSGVEVTGERIAGPASTLTGRVFGERQHNAPLSTQLSLPHATRDATFVPNVESMPATEAGAAARWRAWWGLDPRGLRVAGDVRGEGAAGTFDYTRVAADVVVSRGLFRDIALSVSGGAGTSGGTLPAQRAWFLGGTHTVRGFAPGTLRGDSYWLGRAELALGGSVLRPLVFYDAGWAGAREAWTTSARAIHGAGAGVSFLDGLARIDLARGVEPRTAWRAHLYVEAPF